MRLLSLAVCRQTGDKSATILVQEVDVSSVSIFARNSAREGIVFMTRTLAGNAAAGQRQSVAHEESGHVIHVNAGPDGLVVVAVTDEEYPPPPAHRLLVSMVRDFRQVHGTRWAEAGEREMAYEFLTRAMADYQDPKSTDKIQQIRDEIDSTKEIMMQNIEAAVGRGEDIDRLVAKSSDLSDRSKMFYKKSKKMNRCCVIQ